MLMKRLFVAVFLFSALVFVAFADGNRASEMTAAERGRYNLTHRPYGFPLLNEKMFSRLWTVWEPEWKSKINPEDPARIRALTLERYGFSEAPYENGGAPMQFVSTQMGWVQTCMLCHGGRLPGTGESFIGTPNSELDMQTLYEDVVKLTGLKGPINMSFGMSRGRTNAFVFSIELLRRRNEDLSTRATPMPVGQYQDADLDPIPWWHLKKKTALYVDAGIKGDFTRPIMQFTMGEPSGEKIKSWEADFKDILAYLRTIEPPRYPWPVDAKLASEGKKVFEQNCAACHGTYGPDGKYPNRVVPLEQVGTDPVRIKALTREFRAYFNRTWFAANARAEEDAVGYVAPPLDGVWASAPYFHNGSVPTVYGVLTSEARPKYFRRTGIKDYDTRDLGLKVESLAAPASKDLPAEARRRVIDTTLPGLGNGGHSFGFHLTEKQKRGVIEYLKTL
jgi:hypothetical protein